MRIPQIKNTLSLLMLMLFGLLGHVTAALAQDLEDFTFFRSRGYAAMIAVDAKDEIFFLQETADTLLFVGEGKFEEGVLYEIDEEDGEPTATPLFFDVEETATGFVAFTRDGTRRIFDRLLSPPDKFLFTELNFDPEVDFEVFWQLIDENSTYLELTGLNWQQVYNTYRPQVHPGTTPDELFDLLTSLLTLLGDSHHGVLIAEELEREFALRVPQPSEWLIDRSAEIFEVLEAESDAGLEVAGNGRMAYGTFEDGRIGYLAILTFVGFSDDLLSDTEVFTADLDQALAALAATESLVLDLRWNTGGFSHLPNVLMSRFTDTPRLAYRKQARWGKEFTELQEIFYGPEGVLYTGSRPIVALISDLTSSAGELTAGMLKELDRARLVGVPTFGRFSSGLQMALPGGFKLRASNEKIFWNPAPGVDLEGQGIVPDVTVEPSQQALDAGVDTLLQAALAQLTEPTGCTASPTVLCLGDDGRFAVRVAWRDFVDRTGAGQSASLTGESGSFWFFDPENIELVVKVLDGSTSNDHFWVFYASLTNVEFNLSVTDTLTGEERFYHNDLGHFASRGDILAFPRASKMK